MKSLVFYSVISTSAQKWEPIYSFCVDLFESIAMKHYKTSGFSLILRLSESVVNLNNLYGYEGMTALTGGEFFSGALRAGLTVQGVTCMCVGAGLAVRRVL